MLSSSIEARTYLVQQVGFQLVLPPVLPSKARNRRSFVAPINTRSPAVAAKQRMERERWMALRELPSVLLILVG
jgi:hypothetical protein